MKIGFITERAFPYHGGCETRYYKFGKELVRRGHEVDIITGAGDITNSEAISTDRVRANQKLGFIEIMRYLKYPPKIGDRSLADLVRFGRAISKFITEFGSDYDILEINSIPLLHLLQLNSKELDNLIITWHEVWQDYWNRDVKGILGKNIERQLLKRGRAQVVVSHFTANRIAELTDTNVRRRVITNGVDLQFFKEHRGISNDAPNFIYVGRLTRDKNVFPYLMKVMKRYHEMDPKACLHIVGHGPLKNIIAQTARKHSFVQFHGVVSIEQLLDLYQTCDVFVLPSIREGSGIAALEAMANGCPLVVRDSRFNATAFDTVSHDKNGYVAQESNFPVLMHKAWDERERLGRNARHTASQYLWSDLTGELLKFYQEILNL